MKKYSVMTKLMISYLLLAFGMALLTAAVLLPTQLNQQKNNLENTITQTALLLGTNDLLAEEAASGQLSGSSRSMLDTVCASNNDFDYLVIADQNGIRLYHPDNVRIGEHFTGGDETEALQKNCAYISTRKGNTDIQKRAFHSLVTQDGRITGFVMVSASMQTIRRAQLQTVKRLLLVLCMILAAGLFFAWIISQNIRRSLLGYEPKTIARMYLQRDEILDTLNEEILVIQEDGSILYQNEAAKKSFPQAMFPDDFPLAAERIACMEDNLEKRDLLAQYQGRTLLVNLMPAENRGQAENPASGNTLTTAAADADTSHAPSPTPSQSAAHAKAVLLIIRDRTEATRLAEQLTGTSHVIEALRANTHEYMNKLHVILGLLQIGDTKQAIRFITNVSDDIESGYQTIVRQIKDPSVAALILGKQSHARELDIHFSLRRDSILPENNPYLSSRDLITVVGNLIENAFEAINGTAGIRQAELFICCSDQGLTISVDDTGCGMSEEQIQKIYSGQYTTKGEGHGIGLGLIREIVKKHHGFLEIESEVGEGTSFTVSIGNIERKN